MRPIFLVGFVALLLTSFPANAEGDGRSAIPDLYAAFECKNGRACPAGKPRPFGSVRVQAGLQPAACDFYRKPSATVSAAARQRLLAQCENRKGARLPPV